MSAGLRNTKVENPSRANGSEKPVIICDRQKPRFYSKKTKVLALYHEDIGKFLHNRKRKRQIQAENAQIKWELRISTLLG